MPVRSLNPGLLKRELGYRPDVDGLRGVAVLSVLAFHAYPYLLPGGFVGVDIFFVISGFLISGIIFTRLTEQKFTFSDFYVRRVKRIFPSLILVLLASLILGWVVLLRDEYTNLGKHVAAGAAFVSNLVYWREIDYFDGAAEFKPLLHLWSLGVEEQFYIIWPPVLYIIWKQRWNLHLVIGLLLIASFCTNVWASSRMPVATFYLPITRLWELVAGSWLAYSQVVHQQLAEKNQNSGILIIGNRKVSHADLAAICGLIFLSVALVVLSRKDAYPGWWALLPTVGTFLLIWANQRSWINRNLLSGRLLVAIGLISYPLYLWHWPLLAFGRIIAGDNSAFKVVIPGLLLSFLLAWLTTRYLERPIRSLSVNPTKVIVPFGLALGFVGLLGLGGNIGVMGSRLDAPSINDLNVALKDWKFPKDTNFSKKSGFRLIEEPGTTESAVLFIGDSHVEQYFPRVRYLTSRRDLTTHSAVFATHEGCPPIPNVNLFEPGIYCDSFFEFAQNEAKKRTVKWVVFGGFWEHYFLGEYSSPRSPVPVYYTKDPATRQILVDDVVAMEIFRNFSGRITSLRHAGKEIYIILSNATGPAFDPRRMLINRLSSRHAAVNTKGFISKNAFRDHVKPITAMLRHVAESTGSTVVDPLDYFCEGSVCRTNTADGKAKYRDSDHLRASYAETTATFIDEILVQSKKIKHD